MTDSDLLDLKRIGRIIVEINRYKQRYAKQKSDQGVSTYLKEWLCCKDFLFWQVISERFGESDANRTRHHDR